MTRVEIVNTCRKLNIALEVWNLALLSYASNLFLCLLLRHGGLLFAGSGLVTLQSQAWPKSTASSQLRFYSGTPFRRSMPTILHT